jgi:hypothetical protein
MIIETTQETKIILSLEYIDELKVLATLRNDKIVVINIEKLEIEEIIGVNFARIIRTIEPKEQLYAIAGKQNLALLKKGKLTKN